MEGIRLERWLFLNKIPPRPAQAARLLCSGMKTPEIARSMKAKEPTVKKHLSRIANVAGMSNPVRDRFHWHIQLVVVLTQPPADPFRQAIEKLYGLGSMHRAA